MKIRSRSLSRFFVVLAFAGALTACEDAAGLGEHANISRIILTIAGQPVTIHLAGANGSFTLDEGTHVVTAAAFDPDGDRLDLDNEYELVIGTNDEDVARYVSASNLGGTLVTASGTTTLRVQIDHDHGAEFGPHNVPVNVN